MHIKKNKTKDFFYFISINSFFLISEKKTENKFFVHLKQSLKEKQQQHNDIQPLSYSFKNFGKKYNNTESVLKTYLQTHKFLFSIKMHIYFDIIRSEFAQSLRDKRIYMYVIQKYAGKNNGPLHSIFQESNSKYKNKNYFTSDLLKKLLQNTTADDIQGDYK